MSADLALWTYCVARAGATLPDGLPGVHPAHTVARVEHGGLVALVSPVPMDEFGEQPLRRNLNDLAWLERVARCHEWVLEQALDAATIVPLRLCTIFADERGVTAMLTEERASLDAALEALDGTQEWAVKLLVDRAALEAATRGAPVEPAPEAGGSGTAYLQRRREERRSAEAAGRLAAELAEDVHRLLAEGSLAARRNPPQNRELSGHRGDMLLNGAYLVERGRAERLRDLVLELQERHRALGAELLLAGPLPPYTFVPGPDSR